MVDVHSAVLPCFPMSLQIPRFVRLPLGRMVRPLVLILSDDPLALLSLCYQLRPECCNSLHRFPERGNIVLENSRCAVCALELNKGDFNSLHRPRRTIFCVMNLPEFYKVAVSTTIRMSLIQSLLVEGPHCWRIALQPLFLSHKLFSRRLHSAQMDISSFVNN